MSTDIGYLQTKIRELKEEMEQIKTEVEESKRRVDRIRFKAEETLKETEANGEKTRQSYTKFANLVLDTNTNLETKIQAILTQKIKPIKKELIEEIKERVNIKTDNEINEMIIFKFESIKESFAKKTEGYGTDLGILSHFLLKKNVIDEEEFKKYFIKHKRDLKKIFKKQKYGRLVTEPVEELIENSTSSEYSTQGGKKNGTKRY